MAIEIRRITSRSEWLAWRMADITASDAAAVLGFHPDRTAARVWAEKSGLIPPTQTTQFLEFRLALEAAAIDWVKMRRPTWEVRRSNVYARDDGLRLAATPDAVMVDPERAGFGVLECKSVVRHIFERDWTQLDEGPDGTLLAEAPIFHQLQALTGAMLLGASYAIVVGLILDSAGTGALALAPVDRHEAAEQSIRDGVARFWTNTDAGKPPPLNYALDSDVVVALFPKALIKDPPLDLSTDNRMPELLKAREVYKEDIRKSTDACESIDAEIKDKIGAHELATLPGWRVSWKTQKRPERIMPAWEGRVLRVSPTKQEKGSK